MPWDNGLLTHLPCLPKPAPDTLSFVLVGAGLREIWQARIALEPAVSQGASTKKDPPCPLALKKNETMNTYRYTCPQPTKSL